MIELINMFITVFYIEYNKHYFISHDLDIYAYEHHFYIVDKKLPNWFKEKIKYMYD